MLWKWTNFLKGKKSKEDFSKRCLGECINSGINIPRLQKDVANGRSSLWQNVKDHFQSLPTSEKVPWCTLNQQQIGWFNQ